MALNAPASGLRRFVNDSRDITRVELRVAPGAELAVDDATAAQLGPRFKDPDEVAARDAERAGLNDVTDDQADVDVDSDRATKAKPKKKTDS